MDIQRTICLFGLELIGGKDEGTSAIVRIKVRDVDHLVLGADGPVATAAISPDLMTTGEIDHFLDSALAELGNTARPDQGRSKKG
ncbi:MAG: hypothetical protein WD852_05885 [Methyloceanibacter sp.]